MWGRLSTFRRGFVSTLTLNVLARGLSAIATVLLVRSLSVNSFAYVVLFLNVGQFAGSALTGGMRMRYMRVEAERVSRGEPQPTGFALAWAASMALVLGVAALCVVAVRLLQPSDSGDDQMLFVALAAAFTAGHASVELAAYHYQAHLQFARAGTIDVSRGAALLAAALLATFGIVESGPLVAACTAGAVVAVGAISCVPLARRTLRARPLAAIAGDFGRESGWLTGYYLTSAGFSYATIFIVAALLDDQAVASYGAALRYMSIVFGPFPALMAVLRVRSSQHDIVDSTALQIGMLANWGKRAGPPLAVILALAAAAAPFVLPLIDNGRYPDAVPIFQILLISAFVEYVTMPGPNLLLSQRRYQLLAAVYSIALVVQLLAVGAASGAGVVAVAAVSTAVRSIDWLTIAFLATRVRPRKQSRSQQARPGLLSAASYRLARHGGTIGHEVAAGSELLLALGPGEVRRRRRDERALDRLWPGHAINSRIWRDAAHRLGVGFRELDGGYFELGTGEEKARVWMHVPPLDDEVARGLALDKARSHQTMAEVGVPVPEQIRFGIDDLGPAMNALGGASWVVKPAEGTASGQGATPGVRSFDDLRRAAVRAARSGPRQLLEHQAAGEEYRLLLLDGEPLGAVRRLAPVVIGDGRSSIADLLHAENRRRLAAAGEAGLRVITLDLDALLTLERAGLTHRSVPLAEEEVAVKTSRSQGGARDTETVPLDAFAPELIDELRHAVAAFGLRLAGIDLVTPDVSRSLAEAGGAVIEINGTPGLHYHYLVREPDSAVPVAMPILEQTLSARR